MFQIITRRFGKVDIVCNNAGLADEQNWKKMIAVNMVGSCDVSIITEVCCAGGNDGGDTPSCRVHVPHQRRKRRCGHQCLFNGRFVSSSAQPLSIHTLSFC